MELIQNRIDNVLHVLYQSDENYIVPTGVSMYSLLKNNTTYSSFIFHIIDNGLLENSKNHVEEIAHGFKSEVFWIEGKRLERELIEMGARPFKNSYTTYLKLFAFDIIASQYPDVTILLYLDGDTLVVDDLGEIKEILLNKDFGAVYEYTHPEYRNHLNVKGNTFNAGVEILNLSAWRERKYGDVIMSLLKDEKYISNLWLFDQDVLNQVFDGKTYRVSPEYNMTHSFYFCRDVEKYRERFSMVKPFYTKSLIEKGIAKPKIIHYMDVCWTGMPWDKWNANIWKNLYYKYKEQCWKNGIEPCKKKTVERKIGKVIIVFFHKILPRKARAVMYYKLSKFVSARNLT